MKSLANKREDELTLLIIPHAEKKPISIKFHSSLLRFAVAGLLVAITFLAVFIQSYVYMTDKVKELDHLQALTKNQKNEIEELASQTKDLTEQMQEVEVLSNQVRELLDLQHSIEEEELTFGIQEEGGPMGGGLPILSSRSGTRDYISEENLNNLRATLEAKSSEFDKLVALAEDYKEKMDHTPSIMPVDGRINSGFGYRRSPFGGRQEFHNGIDIGAPRGTDILAGANGKVVDAKTFSSYGRTIVIDHGNNYKTLYAHLNGYAVSTGDVVEKGQVIGYVGTSGRSTGPHLHYEVQYKGERVNPINYID